MNYIDIIIDASFVGRRMKSFGTRSLIKIGKATLIERQINILYNIYPSAHFIVVAGFQADRLIKALKKYSYVYVIENQLYETTNVAHSLALGLIHTSARNVLIVYGNLVFNENTFGDSNIETSTLWIDKTRQLNNDKVGVTIVNNEVTQLAYGLSTKWAKIVLLTGLELKLFQRFASAKEKYFGFEILNMVLNSGGRFMLNAPVGMRLAEIDSSKDIALARKVIDNEDIICTR